MFFESSWLIVSRFGRRQIFLAGFSIMITCLLLIGNLAPVTPTEGTKWAQPVLCLIWLGSYSASVGPVAYPFRCRQERHLRSVRLFEVLNVWRMSFLAAAERMLLSRRSAQPNPAPRP
ncbi:uncharacterized protein K444DRAFT_194718 [Hyaloscypha bicolor E]|uniref:Major facilitator superfamily (MFS) profile domain-containing protein n=1 Tax=Hyaloscypha bicolor E TaxID=1095630 RepID=A0A2J6SQ96_9HELO|nr:uncharacterized protein K444DRAFT_194718 [Hyaloscypha bicolor E]PMD52945.1 hypothetical protein K444DRAFT_194718 [Hyaloscypha bicolor E]